MMIATTARAAVLNEGALTVGTHWAQTWCDEMRREGRAVEGGWPGTVAEARARVIEHFYRELTRRHLPQLTQEEIASTTSLSYEKAKHDWLAARDVRPARRRHQAC